MHSWKYAFILPLTAYPQLCSVIVLILSWCKTQL